MTTLYKLTDANDQTYGGCQWGPGITHEADGQGELCTEHWIHATTYPLLAVLLNPIQGNYDFTTAHLWEGEGEIAATDRGLKVGCTRFTTIRRIEIPAITPTQRIAFGILCVLDVYSKPSFVRWASAWLDGSDRSHAAAWAAREQATWAAEQATEATTWAAEQAAACVAWAAWAAAWAETWAAEEATEAATWATGAAATEIDLVALAEKAMEYK